MNIFIFVSIISAFAVAATWKGKKISWWSFVITFFVYWVFVAYLSDRRTVIEEWWEMAIYWAIGAGFFGQVFMAIWYNIVPVPQTCCAQCGRKCDQQTADQG